MEFEANARTSPFLQARARLKNRYNLTMDTDDFIEKAYYIWRDIGNIATQNHEYTIQVPSDGVVELPHDCEFVKSVVSEEVLPNTVRNTSWGNKTFDSAGPTAEVTPYEPGLSADASARKTGSYQFGANVAYTTGAGFIKINSPAVYNRMVTVFYSSIDKDEDGLPLLNDKEVDAIAANLALQIAEIQLFQGKKGADVLVTYMKTESDRLFQAAKIPEKFSDSGLDKVMDIKVSWNRKVYGSKFNLIP